MTGFLEELRRELRSKLPVVLWVILSAAMGVMGPFGSYLMFSFPRRMLFWAPVLAVCMAVAVLLRALVFGGLGLRGRLTAPLVLAGLIALVVSPPVYWLVHALFGATDDAALPGLDEIALLTASVSLGISALRRSVEAGLPAAAELAEDAPAEAAALTDLPLDPLPADGVPAEMPPESRLMRRIAPELQGDLWSISVRDHYVDVLTSAGTASLLMRFGDAVAEAEPVAGLQVHRSHWVALAAVEGAVREGTRLFLTVQGGQRLPVSKAHRAKVEDWLAAAPAAAGLNPAAAPE